MPHMPASATTTVNTSNAPNPARNACFDLEKVNCFSTVGLEMIPDYASESYRPARRRVLPVKQPELLVDLRIEIDNRVRGFEECLAQHGEELARALGSVGVARILPAGLDTAAEIGIRRTECVRPCLAAHAAVQRREAGGAGGQHFEIL